ncbi:MAG: hypothetical protein AAF206_04680 [Bacteroidota bacterium]
MYQQLKTFISLLLIIMIGSAVFGQNKQRKTVRIAKVDGKKIILRKKMLKATFKDGSKLSNAFIHQIKDRYLLVRELSTKKGKTAVLFSEVKKRQDFFVLEIRPLKPILWGCWMSVSCVDCNMPIEWGQQCHCGGQQSQENSCIAMDDIFDPWEDILDQEGPMGGNW